jgi:hypothetical protein
VEALPTQAGATAPQVHFVLGSLLLREDRPGAAAAELERAMTGLPQPPPELQADLAIARRRLGDAAGAATLVAALESRRSDDPVAEARRQRALQRAAAVR